MAAIYTKKGDKGFSKRADGTAVAKGAPIMTAVGNVDELSVSLGVLRSLGPGYQPFPPGAEWGTLSEFLVQVQTVLLMVGGALSQMKTEVSDLRGKTQGLERLIDRLSLDKPLPAGFVLAGKNQVEAQAHTARAICRRCERTLWRCFPDEPEQPDLDVRVYINRLSDALFQLAWWLS